MKQTLLKHFSACNLVPALGAEPVHGEPVFGFGINGMFIFEPTRSECGRFEVDAEATYGLSEADCGALANLNDVLAAASDAALNAGCLQIQAALGLPGGDTAGIHFAEPARRRPFTVALGEYLLQELAHARA